MSGPGKGRYTTYVPKASARNARLNKLFNEQAENDAGVLYGAPGQTNNSEAAKAAVARAVAPVVNGVGGLIPSDGRQVGDPDMFPAGVNLAYGDAPDVSKVEWKQNSDAIRVNIYGDAAVEAGGPANAYSPDPTSPGAGPAGSINVDPLSKDADPGISIDDMKPGYIPGAPGTGTTNPSVTSKGLGTSPFAKDLIPGKSSVLSGECECLRSFTRRRSPTSGD